MSVRSRYLRLFLSADETRTVLSELEELHEHFRDTDGERPARRWMNRQVFQYPFRLFLERCRRLLSRRASLDHQRNLHEKGDKPVPSFTTDLRHSLRSLARSPVMTITIILTVGLGIGATTALFSIIDAVLLRPLPYENPGELHYIYNQQPSFLYPFSLADYLALDEQESCLTDMAGFTRENMVFNRDEIAEQVSGKIVTWNYLQLLGITPRFGRLFESADQTPGSEPRVIVSARFWNRFLEGSDSALGQTVQLDGRGYTLVGVLPSSVGPLDNNYDFFIPGQWEPPSRRGPFFLTVLGRLDPGTDLTAAREELRTLTERVLPDVFTERQSFWNINDLKVSLVGQVRGSLWLLFGAVGAILLLASFNAAILLLARGINRLRELAVRTALGATRARIMQHLLADSVILAAGSALTGFLLLAAGMRLIVAVSAGYLPRSQEIGLSGTTVGFLIVVTLASCLLIGLLPALHGAGAGRLRGLQTGSRAVTSDTGIRRLHGTMVVLQYALSVPLLIGATLLAVSLGRLNRVDIGCETENILTFRLSLPESRYPAPGDVDDFREALANRLQMLPDVEAAGFSSSLPPNTLSMTNNFNLEDHPTPSGQSHPTVPWLLATPGYFATLGITLLEGRMFNAGDRLDAPAVAIVDQAWANRFFPGQSAVGRRFCPANSTDGPWTTVVGVVRDVHYTGLENTSRGTVYRPISQINHRSRSASTVMATATDPIGLVPTVRRIIHDLDPALPLTSVATIEDLTGDSLTSMRQTSVFTGTTALIALILSIIGIYGMMTNFTSRHRRDIGIHIALGGRPGRVSGMIAARGLKLAGIGLVIGIGAALFLSRIMSSLTREVSTAGPLTFVAIAAGILGLALITCFIPAHRAVQLDPVSTLREE